MREARDFHVYSHVSDNLRERSIEWSCCSPSPRAETDRTFRQSQANPELDVQASRFLLHPNTPTSRVLPWLTSRKSLRRQGNRLIRNSCATHRTAWGRSSWLLLPLRVLTETDIPAHSCAVARHGNLLAKASTHALSNALTFMCWSEMMLPSPGKEVQNGRQQHTTYPGRRRKKTTPWPNADSTWSSEKPLLCLHAVTDEDGHPLEDEDESGMRLCNFCGRYLSYVPRTSGTMPTRPFSITFRKLLMVFSGKWTSVSVMKWQLQIKNPLQHHIVFHIVSTGVRVGWGLTSCSMLIDVCLRVPGSHAFCCKHYRFHSQIFQCYCDCMIITTAICFGLHRCSIRCIHPTQRCTSSRQMTDKILEVETTALAHVTCATHDSGILLTDFAAAYPGVNHSWIFHVLEKAELPEFMCQFLCMIYSYSMTEVEFAGKTRGQFLKARGVRQGCPAIGFLFAMVFDPIFGWLHDSISPRNPAAPDFLQPFPCAEADDFAAAVWVSSFSATHGDDRQTCFCANTNWQRELPWTAGDDVSTAWVCIRTQTRGKTLKPVQLILTCQRSIAPEKQVEYSEVTWREQYRQGSTSSWYSNSDVLYVVTFRYWEISRHSSHTLLSQSKIAEPIKSQVYVHAVQSESPNMCSSAVKFNRSCSFVFPVSDDRLVSSLRGGGPGGWAQSQSLEVGYSMATTAVMSSDELHAPTTLQDDSTSDDAEAKNDFWTIRGEFIYRPHVVPRVKLYMPKEETFPIPTKYIDVTRTTDTS